MTLEEWNLSDNLTFETWLEMAREHLFPIMDTEQILQLAFLGGTAAGLERANTIMANIRSKK